MRISRLKLTLFTAAVLLVAAPIATALTCRSMISEPGVICFLSGEDGDNCYYSCYPNQ
jgi:hypothetical protein